MKTNTYSSKSAAKLGAKRKDLDVETLTFMQDKDKRWSWETTTDLEEALEETKQPVIQTDLISNKGIKIEKERPEQNGIVRPSTGGKCRNIWDMCDAIYKDTGELPTRKQMKQLAKDKSWNVTTCGIQMYQWRRFNGFIGRQKEE